MSVLDFTDRAWKQTKEKYPNITIPTVYIALYNSQWYIVMDNTSSITILVGQSKDIYAVPTRKCKVELRPELGGNYYSYFIPGNIDIQIISCPTDKTTDGNKEPMFGMMPFILNNIYPLFWRS